MTQKKYEKLVENIQNDFNVDVHYIEEMIDDLEKQLKNILKKEYIEDEKRFYLWLLYTYGDLCEEMFRTDNYLRYYETNETYECYDVSVKVAHIDTEKNIDAEIFATLVFKYDGDTKSYIFHGLRPNKNIKEIISKKSVESKTGEFKYTDVLKKEVKVDIEKQLKDILAQEFLEPSRLDDYVDDVVENLWVRENTVKRNHRYSDLNIEKNKYRETLILEALPYAHVKDEKNRHVSCVKIEEWKECPVDMDRDDLFDGRWYPVGLGPREKIGQLIDKD